MNRPRGKRGNAHPGLLFVLLVVLVLVSALYSEERGGRDSGNQPQSTKKAQPKPTVKAEKKKRAKTNGSVGSAQTKKRTVLWALAQAPVRAEERAGYDRNLFKHWSDLDRNGCDTRDDILAEGSLRPTDCRSLQGEWYSPYDQKRTTNPSSFDIDHMVPLAEAWDSGASRFSPAKREVYANDRYRPSLIAVSASSNRAKSDQDPHEWLPPNRAYLCRYLRNWVLIKYRWGLSYDQQEKAAIAPTLRNCPRALLQVRLPKRVP